MKKLRESAQALLNLYNYFNGAVIFDENAIAVYYYNNRPDINKLLESDVVGKHLTEIYPELDLEKSTIMEALRTGIPTANAVQTVKTCKGQELKEMNTTLPIFDGKKIIGAVEVSRYLAEKEERGNLFITSAGGRKHRRLYTVSDLISQDRRMNDVKEKISKVAKTDSSVLIYGKTGTGKEVTAEAIHTGGNRADGPFLSQNCAAIPSALLESMLFGTEKGSFTGAENRKGLLARADGGTLFLDEINHMEMGLQAKILRAVEEQKFMPVGSYNARPVNVRIIAAANEEPWRLVQKKRLREDLYYRLRVVQINLPELSEREGDVAYLTDYFIGKYNQRFGKNIQGLDVETKNFFASYSWPGNVRELKNTIEGAYNFAEGHFLKMEDITWYQKKINPYEVQYETALKTGQSLKAGKSLRQLSRTYEAQILRETLQACGSVQQVMATLGISRQLLYHKLKQYHLEKYLDMNKKF